VPLRTRRVSLRAAFGGNVMNAETQRNVTPYSPNLGTLKVSDMEVATVCLKMCLKKKSTDYKIMR
jgi:hypothetical protein